MIPGGLELKFDYEWFPLQYYSKTLIYRAPIYHKVRFTAPKNGPQVLKTVLPPQFMNWAIKHNSESLKVNDTHIRNSSCNCGAPTLDRARHEHHDAPSPDRIFGSTSNALC